MSKSNRMRPLKLLDTFFFEEKDLWVCNPLRIGFALLLSVNLITLLPYRDLWFSESGALPVATAKLILDPDAESILFYLPDYLVPLYFSIMLAACISLAAGVVPRLSAFVLFLLWNSLQHRAILLFDGEDTLFRLFAFYLFLMPLSAASQHSVARRTQRVWPLRLLQLQMCLLYFSTAIEKMRGVHWRNGTALYYVARLDDLFIQQAWMATIFDSLELIQYLSWLVMSFELVLPFALLFGPTRRLAIVAAIVFHLTLAFSMNLFLFQYLMILGICSFVSVDEWRRITGALTRSKKISTIYSGD